MYVEILGTLGIAIILATAGFHHGLGFLFSSEGVTHAATNPLGLDFGGNWLTGAALMAVLAHVLIFYGFESAGTSRRRPTTPTDRCRARCGSR